MNILVQKKSYRKDIDGIRSIAVLAVIIFHFGYLPNGYLGVDIFFVISGYLITNIAFRDALANQFSIIQFYLRRTRRIIPLVLFTSIIAIIVGLFVMLPDDLENLSQSLIATNFFANNILQLITTRDYWDVVNEYKPLMHTWSLAVEEQFYLIFPILFMLFKGIKTKWILPILLVITIISLTLFLSSTDNASKFYLIQYRFFELSLGGLGAIIFRDKYIDNRIKPFALLMLLLMIINLDLSNNVKLFLTLIATLGLLLESNKSNKITSFILENKVMVGIGKISFSLYMWHQIVLAFSRYFIVETYSVFQAFIMFVFIIVISILSYFFIEQPFRDKNKVKTSLLLFLISILFLFSTGLSLYLYTRSGVIKNVPELDINKENVEFNMHSKYNDKIYELNNIFSQNDKIKIFIIGNSFARDWANVLLESKFKKHIEISYSSDISKTENLNVKLNNADYIFFSDISLEEFDIIKIKYKIDKSKVWNVGTKSFGTNNGIFYKNRNKADYCFQRAYMQKGLLERNNSLKKQWGDKYVDLIELVIDKKGKVPVFTPTCKFISQDCRHFTKSGASFFSKLLNDSYFFKKLVSTNNDM